MFFTRFGYQVWGRGGGPPKGLLHNLLMQLFTSDSSKMEVFQTCFYDIVITYNDHSRYLKHVLGRIILSFPYFVYALLGVDSLRGGPGPSLRTPRFFFLVKDSP